MTQDSLDTSSPSRSKVAREIFIFVFDFVAGARAPSRVVAVVACVGAIPIRDRSRALTVSPHVWGPRDAW